MLWQYQVAKDGSLVVACTVLLDWMDLGYLLVLWVVVVFMGSTSGNLLWILTTNTMWFLRMGLQNLCELFSKVLKASPRNEIEQAVEDA